MSSEEEDYMSNTFLMENITEDIKPGLIMSYSEKRRIAASERKKLHDELNKKKHPSIKIIEFHNREKGLSKPIEENNKGFALLQKMGYKPGTGIGKSEDGRTEPVTLSVKNNRKGLGRTEVEREIYKGIGKKQVTCNNAVSADEYRSRVVENFNQRRIEKDLCDSRRACQYLDRRKGLTQPFSSWYWLEDFGGNYKSEEHFKDLDDIDEVQPEDYNQRHFLNSEDSSDVDNDSTVENDDSAVENDDSDVENDDSIADEDSAVDEDVAGNDDSTVDEDDDGGVNENNKDCEHKVENISTDEKLRTLTSYLRETYYYCVWCGTEYEDETDLMASCPGDTADLH